FFFQAEDGIRDFHVTGVQTCALPISSSSSAKCCPSTWRKRTRWCTTGAGTAGWPTEGRAGGPAAARAGPVTKQVENKKPGRRDVAPGFSHTGVRELQWCASATRDTSDGASRPRPLPPCSLIRYIA